MKLASQANQLDQTAQSQHMEAVGFRLIQTALECEKVLRVDRCAEVNLSYPEPYKSLEVIQHEAEPVLEFIKAYLGFMQSIKDLKSSPVSERHVLSAALQHQLSQVNGCDSESLKSISVMRALRDFVGSLTSSQQLLSHCKLIVLLKFETSRLPAGLMTDLIKDSVDRLNLMWRSQFVTPITEVTRETCRELAKLLMNHDFIEKDAKKIACMSEFKLRGLDPTQGKLYQGKLAELKQIFTKMTVETYRSIKNSIMITEDS
jgi:hypothetical protein